MTDLKKYLKPVTVEEAVQMAASQGSNFRYIAGGTDVLLNKFQGNELADCLVDLSGIKALRKITVNDTYLSVGALVSLEEICNNDLIRKNFPALSDAASAVGSPMIRKTATLGGNLLCENRCIFYNQSEWWREAVGFCLKCDGDICIATGGKKNCFSKFVADTAIALISLDATIAMVEGENQFSLPVESLYSGDGVAPHTLKRASLIKSIQIPLGQGSRSVFKKLRQRDSLEFSSLTTSVSINANGKIKIVLGGVDPKPIIIEGSVNEDQGELIRKAEKKPRIVDNDVYSRKYRKEMIRVFLERSFAALQ